MILCFVFRTREKMCGSFFVQAAHRAQVCVSLKKFSPRNGRRSVPSFISHGLWVEGINFIVIARASQLISRYKCDVHPNFVLRWFKKGSVVAA